MSVRVQRGREYECQDESGPHVIIERHLASALICQRVFSCADPDQHDRVRANYLYLERLGQLGHEHQLDADAYLASH